MDNNPDKQYDEIEEAAEKEVSPEELNLSDTQIENINKELDKAHKNGIISARDKMGAFGMIAKLPKHEQANGEKYTQDYLKKAERYSKKYTKDVEKGVFDGLISADEAKDWLEKYKKANWKERKDIAKKDFSKVLERKQLEKKKFIEILSESPHFSEKGKINAEGKKLLKTYESMNEGRQAVEKRKLINQLSTLDQVHSVCEDREVIAAGFYKEGNYDGALKIMKRNLRFASQYPESKKLQELGEKAEASVANLEYELGKDHELRELREDRDDLISVADPEKSIDSSKKLLKGVDGMMKETFSIHHNVIPRDQRWITSYMKGQEKEAKKTHETLLKTYDTLQLKEEDDKKTDAEIEEQRAELAKDKVLQANAKAYSDIDFENPDQGQSPAGKKTGRTIEHQDQENIADEVKDGDQVKLDETERHLQEREAEKLLQKDDVTLSVTKKGKELSGQDAEREVARNMLDQQERKIRTSNLSKEAKNQELQRLADQRKRPDAGMGRTLWNASKNAQGETGLMTSGSGLNTQQNNERMENIINQSSAKDDEKKAKERAKEAQKRKKQMMERI